MNLTNLQYKALYEEMLEVNEEIIQGMFLVSNEEELKEQAMQFLINKWKDEEKYDDDDEYYMMNTTMRLEILS